MSPTLFLASAVLIAAPALPERLARFPVQGPPELAGPAAHEVDAALARWSRWPRVPAVEMDGLGLMGGLEKALACSGEDACSAQAARMAQARYVLFCRIAADAVTVAVYDAGEGKLVKRVLERTTEPLASIELAVARALAPEEATGLLVVDGAGPVEVDGEVVRSPARVAAGTHQVRIGRDPPRALRVPLRGEIRVVAPEALRAPRWGAHLLVGAGALVMVAGVVGALGGLTAVAAWAERRITASQPERLEGSARLQRFVLWQAGVAGGLAAGMMAVAALLLGSGAALLLGGATWEVMG
ncbi:MAG: hypothetical protein HY904_13005 [Deltaproteobacteria bacterium]|nr:hypothetical protein [Deltaproteobacteria bacterium]